MHDEGLDRVWRPRPAGRLAAWVLVVVGVVVAAGSVVVALGAAAGSSTQPVSSLVVGVMAGALAVAAWRLGVHPLIGITRAGVLVRNPVRSVLIPWSDISSCSPGYSGITIYRNGSRPVSAWAVQKSNAATWAGRSVRADQVVDCIEALAASSNR